MKPIFILGPTEVACEQLRRAVAEVFDMPPALARTAIRIITTKQHDSVDRLRGAECGGMIFVVERTLFTGRIVDELLAVARLREYIVMEECSWVRNQD